MAFTQSDLDKLDAAIAAGCGVKTITFSDRTVVFNTPDEFIVLRRMMRQEIGAAAGTPTTRYATTSKGLGL